MVLTAAAAAAAAGWRRAAASRSRQLGRRRVDRLDRLGGQLLQRRDPERALHQKGALTVATDKPAYPPWFESNNPANGKGYESAVAYAIAKQLGFKPSQVHWAYEPFDASYAPGPKKFDFDINEISYTAAAGHRRDVLEQLLRRPAGAGGAEGHADRRPGTRPAELKSYVYGDQIGTTSLAFITSQIQPTAPAEGVLTR